MRVRSVPREMWPSPPPTHLLGKLGVNAVNGQVVALHSAVCVQWLRPPTMSSTKMPSNNADGRRMEWNARARTARRKREKTNAKGGRKDPPPSSYPAAAMWALMSHGRKLIDIACPRSAEKSRSSFSLERPFKARALRCFFFPLLRSPFPVRSVCWCSSCLPRRPSVPLRPPLRACSRPRRWRCVAKRKVGGQSKSLNGALRAEWCPRRRPRWRRWHWPAAVAAHEAVAARVGAQRVRPCQQRWCRR